MKFFTACLSICLISFSAFSIEIPEGGTNMILDAISNHTRIGTQGIISVVDADHTEFDKALRLSVTSQPENYWNFQVQFETNMLLETGDVCLVSFWARTTQSNSEAGEGLLAAIIENNQTYEKPLNFTFKPGGEWTHFVYGFKSNMSLPLERHKAAFFLGYAVQTIEVADIQFLNYKNKLTLADLPEMEITWAGIELDAPWRDEAALRIEKFRKGNVVVKLVDANNNPVQNALVSLEMKKHKFAFGSAIDGKYYLNSKTYRNHIHELFNEIVFENDLKWRPWESRVNHSYILRAIDSLQNNGISVRGHNLIWPGWNYLPNYLNQYENDPVRMKTESLDHIEETAGFTKGKLVDWDVLNEPFTNHVLQDICGDTIMAGWFKKAKEVDPEVKRYINDYSILGNGGTNINHQNGYFDIIEYIDEQGGQIDGIGLQGHFSELMTGIPKVMEILDRFASLNKEIKITEFDINSENDELKSSYTRDFMTATFSHPHVKGFLCWGFWAGRHWKPEAAYYDLSWNIRPQGEMYKSLVFDEWWTPSAQNNSNSSGISDFGSCFLGTYNVEVEYNGKTIVKTIPVHYNNENEIVLNVDDETVVVNGQQHAETPVFTSVINNTEIKKDELKIYPNPASTQLNIQLNDGTNELYHIEVFNISGRCVLSQQTNLEAETTLKLPNLKPGLYILSLQGKHKLFARRFIIQ